MSISPDTSVDLVPRPVTPGPEMADLRRFFPDVTWSGTIHPGGMGPGTPEMTAAGQGRHAVIQDGRWIVGDYEQDQFLLDGSFVLTWQLHLVTGWAPETGDYRATIADNYGHAAVYCGSIEGDRLTLTTIGDEPVRLRLVWDLTAPDVIVWRNEMSADGAPWFLIEEYRMVPG